ncbi:MAG: hypothetical protein PUI78_04050 [Treponema sp.]|nr:hypothetical protein [Treponema sp.]
MFSINFKDLEIIKSSLSNQLKSFSGSVNEKQKTDCTYLKIYKLFKEIELYAKTLNLSTEEIQNLELELSYNPQDISRFQAEKENLSFDFN